MKRHAHTERTVHGLPSTHPGTQTGSKPARSAPAKWRWSQEVTERSDALDLQKGVFSERSASGIARALKRSAERSKRRKATPFQSAMSMLNFYINRGGRQLPESRKKKLQTAKVRLRELFGRVKV
ncbi:MAG: DUF3175 domain-containing protein [Burkholderiaceae bacterium]|jgi:hypothetical protein